MCATLHECDPRVDADPPIGRPIDNVRIYLLDERGEPVPAGVPGELHVGGAGVARGYLNRPELTAERFIQSPFVVGDRLYKTGDLARYLPDGTVEFLGRNDFQVKLRGFRVELGEIEACLMRHDAVRDAVVVAREDSVGEKRLVAYYTTSGFGRTVTAEALQQHAQSALPDYMVPAAYVALDALPLTPNGKVDRKALPAAEDTAHVLQAFEAPAGELESAIAAIWCEVLDLARVGRRDDFFDLGGHSLLALRALSRLHEGLAIELDLNTLFDYPVLCDFAREIASATGSAVLPIERAGRDEPLPLSFAQRRLWFLAQMDGGSEAYHIPLGLRLTGELDRLALRRALDRLVARHEMLRTTFTVAGGEPVQRVAPVHGGFLLIEHDLVNDPNAAAGVDALAAQEVRTPFDLAAGPLIRGRLIAIGAAQHVLLITMHHIVSDGWSMGVLMREVSALYRAYRAGEDDPLAPLSIQYADYAAWQRRWLSGEALREQSAYWQQALHDAPALLELPADRPRPKRQDFTGDHVPIDLGPELTAKIKALSQRHGTTLFMTLMTAWGILLSRLSGQSDVVVGTPVANRTRSEVEDLIGFFVNTLALRMDVAPDATVSEMLVRVQALSLHAQAHQDLPFEHVVEIVNPARSLAQSPLFQAMFVWQNNEHGEVVLPGLRIDSLHMPFRTAKFDLTLEVGETHDRITGVLEYATALFDRATAERYAGYLRTLLAAMVDGEDERVDRLTLLPEAERNLMLLEWNATDAPYPSDRRIDALVEAQAAQTPDAVAVVHGTRRMTYAELDERANRFAHYLRGIGVRPGSRVALCMQRSAELVVAELAILKCG
ncbi:MAG TPA: condensation domain-containing protein, partial [Candidatus Elarobacter sp.]|nr:condensation domain-containing protein [Candidatus Elarobacter sp.]